MTTNPDDPQWHELRLDSGEELWAWAAYFQAKMGSLPAGMRMLELRRIDVFLVPCQWPEWFDTDYAKPDRLPKWPIPEQVPDPTPASRAHIGRLADAVRSAAKGLLLPNEIRERRQREKAARAAEALVTDAPDLHGLTQEQWDAIPDRETA